MTNLSSFIINYQIPRHLESPAQNVYIILAGIESVMQCLWHTHVYHYNHCISAHLGLWSLWCAPQRCSAPLTCVLHHRPATNTGWWCTTFHRHRSPLCTMMHNAGWWCTTQSCTIEVVHNVGLTNPAKQTDRRYQMYCLSATRLKKTYLCRVPRVCENVPHDTWPKLIIEQERQQLQIYMYFCEVYIMISQKVMCTMVIHGVTFIHTFKPGIVIKCIPYLIKPWHKQGHEFHECPILIDSESGRKIHFDSAHLFVCLVARGCLLGVQRS